MFELFFKSIEGIGGVSDFTFKKIFDGLMSR